MRPKHSSVHETGSTPKILKRQIPHGHGDYYRALAQPVLMVRYHAPTGELYVRWFHQYDRYLDGAGPKTLTFRWYPEDRWRDGRAQELVEEARAFLRLRSSMAAFPLELHLDCRARDVDKATLAAQLQRRCNPLRDIVRYVSSPPTPASCVLHVDDDQMRLDLSRVTAATIHYNGATRPSLVPADIVACDALVLLALTLHNVGQASPCARLADAAFAQSRLTSDEEIAHALATEMVRARHIHAALRTFEALDAHEDTEVAAASFWLAVYMHAPTLAEDETQALREVTRRRIDRRLSTQPKSAAADAFNLSCMELDHGEPSVAATLLEQARELQPRYAKRPQWWLQRGNIHLAGGEFEAAAEAFGNACRHKGDMLCQLRLIEALAAVGRYGEAMQTVKASDAQTKSPVDRWVAHVMVAGRALEAIVGVVGDNQQRDLTAHEDLERALAAAYDRGTDDGRLLSDAALISYLERDGLCATAWQMLTASDEATPEQDLDAAIASAWTHPESIDDWHRAVLWFLAAGDPLVEAILVVGDDGTDGALLPALASTAEHLEETDGEADSDRQRAAEAMRMAVTAAEHSAREARRQREGTILVRPVPSGRTFTLINVLGQ